MGTTETRLTVEEALYAVERLLDWADNESGVTTFAKFLSLTGLGGEITVWASSLGYLEASMLATALEAWATHPNDVQNWLCDQGI